MSSPIAASPPANTVFSSVEDEMYVTKRNGQREIVSFDKILKRIKTIGQEANIKINYTSLVIKVIDQLYDGISTTKLDELTAEQCASLSSTHPDYNTLAGRITISNHHKNTSSSFVEVMNSLYDYHDKQSNHSPLVSDKLHIFVNKNAEELDKLCDFSRDYLIEYFGFKTLEKSYLMKINKVTVERPQYMWLRVAIGIHVDNMEKIKETYNAMSLKYFTHATPTLFNAGTPRPQLSSCFLLAMENDSVDGIYNTLKDCALISKWAGGIGLHIHNIRATGSHIRGTNGFSNGIVPMLKVFNNTAKYIDQCIVPETVIYTTQGAKEIQHCYADETEIYNSYGEIEIIQNVLEHQYDGEMLEIETVHSIFPLKITPEHPICVLQLHYKEEDDIITVRNSLDKGNSRFEWVDAKNVGKDCMIVYPIPRVSNDVAALSNDDCLMYGLLLKYGYMDNSDETCSISFTPTEYIREFVETYLTEKLINYKIQNEDVNTVVSWTRTINMPFRYSDLYDDQNIKRMHHKWINLPIEKGRNILKCLFDTESGVDDLIFDSASLLLVESVRFLLIKMGVLAGGSISNKGVKPTYRLFVPKTREICELMNIQYDETYKKSFIHYDNYLLSQVKDVKTSQYKGILYDLQMKSEHNYLIHNGLIHNGGGRRNGSFAIYLETWHADIEMFLQMRKNHGDEELKARDLFYSLWISDLFMERVKTDGKWTLMCPDESPGLADVYGDEFVELYTRYEDEGRGRKTMKARDLWFQVLDAQMETGTPYLCYKDAANKKSNQQNVGTIKSSNLCSEIIEYSDDKETAVCNLASIALPAFIDNSQSQPRFDYEKLHEITKIITYNLNQIIDVNYYPTPKTEISNLRHRPIGIGCQGLADVFMMMNIPFHSEDAKVINRNIFETIYHGALERSCEMSKLDGSYETFIGSPASNGKLQFDLWGVTPSDRYDWADLKNKISEDGLRNSLLLAPMPTASTSQILGYNECIEPITSNIYNRRTLAGEFILANKYLMNDLIKLDLWNEKIKNNIIANHGSVQHIELIPQEIRDKYKTVWEIPMRHLIDMAAERGAFICQSQSLNLWLEDPNYSNLTSMHFYAWSKGLKTGIYYLRRRGRHQAQQFTIEPEKKKNSSNIYEESEEICEMCSS